MIVHLTINEENKHSRQKEEISRTSGASESLAHIKYGQSSQVSSLEYVKEVATNGVAQ